MTECVLWPKAKFWNGYGMTYRNGKTALAHRVAYEDAFGPIPRGVFVCHRCDTPACVNPDHLFLGTPAENSADRDAKSRQARGERNGEARLTEEAAVFSMARLLAGETQQSVADAFGVSQKSISNLWRGETWRHCFWEK